MLDLSPRTVLKRSRQQGQSLLEFAMVLPILLLIVGGVIEFGRAYYQYNTLSKAVREGARYMSSSDYDPIEMAQCRNLCVYGNSTGAGSPILPGLTTSDIAITARAPVAPATGPWTLANPPKWITVSANYTFTPLIGSLINLNVTFTPQVEMRYVGLNATF
jgi:Flp pilus assembly protein TadG